VFGPSPHCDPNALSHAPAGCVGGTARCCPYTAAIPFRNSRFADLASATPLSRRDLDRPARTTVAERGCIRLNPAPRNGLDDDRQTREVGQHGTQQFRVVVRADRRPESVRRGCTERTASSREALTLRMTVSLSFRFGMPGAIGDVFHRGGCGDYSRPEWSWARQRSGSPFATGMARFQSLIERGTSMVGAAPDPCSEQRYNDHDLRASIRPKRRPAKYPPSGIFSLRPKRILWSMGSKSVDRWVSCILIARRARARADQYQPPIDSPGLRSHAPQNTLWGARKKNT